VPVRQDIAITGSVDQKGRVQAVGGINEKVEGFFDACRSKGASGSEGVIIPEANVDHLVLADRVVEAARSGRFRVWPVGSVDEALALLAHQRVGRRDREGRFPAGTVNARIEARLASMAKASRELGDGRRRDDRDAN
jgi:predicted ATP-dependent protease